MDYEIQRIVQETVPGKQITLAHIIANIDDDVYKKLGLICDEKNSLGILTITPSEASIIAADICLKSGRIRLGFVDRFCGSVVIVGDISSIEAALKEVIMILSKSLGFSTTSITIT